MTTWTWSLWAAVFRPLVIGVGAGLIVALMIYVVGVSCGWFRQKLKLTKATAVAGGLEVANSGGNDAGAQGTAHPDGLPSNMGVPNSGAEGLPPREAHAHATVLVDLEMGEQKDITEAGESVYQPFVSANEQMVQRPQMKTCCTSSQEE